MLTTYVVTSTFNNLQFQVLSFHNTVITLLSDCRLVHYHSLSVEVSEARIMEIDTTLLTLLGRVFPTDSTSVLFRRNNPVQRLVKPSSIWYSTLQWFAASRPSLCCISFAVLREVCLHHFSTKLKVVKTFSLPPSGRTVQLPCIVQTSVQAENKHRPPPLL